MALNFKTIAATALVLLPAMLPNPASALDETQKKEIGEFVRAYLIENPEIMLDVQDALQKKQEEARLKKASSAVADHKDALFPRERRGHRQPEGRRDGGRVLRLQLRLLQPRHADMDAMLRRDKNIRFVLKEFPILGPDSVAAHKVSDAVRKLSPDKYGDFFHAMMTRMAAPRTRARSRSRCGLGVTEEAHPREDEGQPERRFGAGSLSARHQPRHHRHAVLCARQRGRLRARSAPRHSSEGRQCPVLRQGDLLTRRLTTTAAAPALTLPGIFRGKSFAIGAKGFPCKAARSIGDGECRRNVR